MKTSPCRGCGEPMIWTTTSKGKNMPVDEEEVRLMGEQLGFLLREEGGKVYADAVRGKSYGGPARVSHWSTCPNAADFRKEKKA